MLRFYVDESCTNHQFLLVGGLLVPAALEHELRNRLALTKHTHRCTKELKWTRVSNSKLQMYREFVDPFFDLCKKGQLNFHVMVIDATDINPRLYRVDAEIGHHKMLYQLLLHRVGRYHGQDAQIIVEIDSRSTDHNPATMVPMLNYGLRNTYGIDCMPFRDARFLDSRDCEVIQLNDVLLGALGWRENKHGDRPVRNAAKTWFAEYISDRLRDVDCNPVWTRARNHTLWRFCPKKKKRDVAVEPRAAKPLTDEAGARYVR